MMSCLDRQVFKLAGSVYAFMYGDRFVVFQLSIFQRLLLKLRGKVFLTMFKDDSWELPQPLYVVNCKKHGWFVDYPRGYKRYFLCPACLEEETRCEAGGGR